MLVLAVHKDDDNDKHHKEQRAKGQLSLRKHGVFDKNWHDRHRKLIFGKITTYHNDHIMKNQLNAVHAFHTAFKLGINQQPTASIGLERLLLRYELMREENEEYLEAAKNEDLIEVADALGDMLYILCGTIIEHGMHDVIEAVFDEIQRSNMSKLGADGKPIYRADGKVLKGPHYFKPDFTKLLK